ncbi:MAG: hydantoinase B/oxoprolinase family protein, partial [Rhodospirillaceae bacterium]|nr:hydantoinase B/oxoprolinase family protein [Rhodospirillaceae bacterium]
LRSIGLLAGCVAQAVEKGRMPADQETIRYTGFYGDDLDGEPFLSREVLGGGSGGRYYADGSDAIHIVPNSRNQPAEFTETRFPILVEKLGLWTDSGGAGTYRGGLGYEKEYRMLVDCSTIVTADRVRLGCYGVNGGQAGQPFGAYVDAEGRDEKLGGLVDNEPIKAGEILRVRTTGGGGWGDPLDRDTAAVLHDVIQGKVSRDGAKNDYGVVFAEGADGPQIDDAATDSLRAELRAARTEPLEMINRGPGMKMFEKRS